jgi:hypothetical protein
MSGSAPMTGPQVRALLALQTACAASASGLVSPREIAHALWPNSPGWAKRSWRKGSNNGGALGATMPMKAATLLWRLWKRRLAAPDRRGRWRLTDSGGALARQLMEKPR